MLHEASASPVDWVVKECRGEIKISPRNHAPRVIDSLASIKSGDSKSGTQISLGANGHLTLHNTKTSVEYILWPNTVAHLSDKECLQDGKTGKLESNGGKVRANGPVIGTASLVTGTRATGKPDIYAVGLFDTAITETNPTFRWENDKNAESYTLEVKDVADNYFFRDENVQSPFRYPADAKELKPGSKYFWTLSTVIRPNVGGTAAGPKTVNRTFWLISPDTVQKRLEAYGPAADEWDAADFRADSYRQLELWDDLIQLYKDLIAAHPDVILLRLRLLYYLKQQNRDLEMKAQDEEISQRTGIHRLNYEDLNDKELDELLYLPPGDP